MTYQIATLLLTRSRAGTSRRYLQWLPSALYRRGERRAK